MEMIIYYVIVVLILDFAPFRPAGRRGSASFAPQTTQLFSSSRTKGSSSRKIWRELADPTQHRDFMFDRHSGGGDPVESSRDNLLQHYVYFLRLNSKFVFVFNGLAQVYQCRNYFSQKLHPHTRQVRYRQEYSHHDLGPWYTRLPKGITETKRQYILKQLDAMVDRYGKDYDFVHQKRYGANIAFHDRTDWLKHRQKRRATYKAKLLEDLHCHHSDGAQQQRDDGGADKSVTNLVWKAIEREVCPDKKSKKPVEQFLQSQIRAAQKVVDKIPSAPPKETFKYAKDPAFRLLSKRRQKIMERQRVRQVEDLKEMGRPIRSFLDTLEDTNEVMTAFRQENKGSSSQEFQTLLEDIETYQSQLRSVQKPMSDYLFSIDLARFKN